VSARLLPTPVGPAHRIKRQSRRGDGPHLLPQVQRRVLSQGGKALESRWGLLRHRIPTHAFYGESGCAAQADEAEVCAQVSLSHSTQIPILISPTNLVVLKITR